MFSWSSCTASAHLALLGHEVGIANREKTGRVVGTVAAICLIISVLAIVYMATRPRAPSKDDSKLQLLPPPAAQAPNQ